MTESTGLDVITTSPDELNRQHLEFHKLVRAKLEQMLATSRSRYDGIDVRDIAATASAQADVRMLSTVLQLPERVFEEEKKKASGK